MTPPGSGSGWLLVPGPLERARHRLFCFPYAGGGASVFDAWPSAVPAGVEVVLVQPPGRESRLLEPAFRDLRELTVELVRHLPRSEVPFSFYGHSMGALMAFELARELTTVGNGPANLFVGASRAPHADDPEPPIYDLPDTEFVARLVERYDAIPEEVLSSEELMKLLVPQLKADLQLVETYQVDLATSRLDIPIYAYAGERDGLFGASQVERWRELTSGDFAMSTLPGDHFFLASCRDTLLASISARLGA